jgi:hypothetical protein
MKKQIIGYVGTLGGAVIGLMTLASVSGATPNYLVTAVLALMALALFGVGWYGLSAEPPKEEAA